jgi:predicted MFS family arabinose efflux permease
MPLGIVFLLAAIQFAHILDFVILMPLGPTLMEELDVSAGSFSYLVSAYNFSAAVMGICVALFIERFERRAALLVLFSGFIAATAACGFADSFTTLMAARICAGAFGGVVNAAVFAIVGELVPKSHQGRAMGVLMAAFSVASVVGVPFGLYLAETVSWNAPFLFLAGFSLVLAGIVPQVIPRIPAAQKQNTASTKSLNSAWGVSEAAAELFRVVKQPRHLLGFGLVIALMLSGFAIIPFLATFLVHNVGLDTKELPYVYLAGGSMTVLSSQLIGRATDRFGHTQTLVIVCMCAWVPILWLTHAGQMPLVSALCMTTLFMVFVSGRFVPTMALVSTLADPTSRGAFMSLFASVQQAAAGLSAVIGGLLISEGARGELTGFPTLGLVSVAMTGVLFALLIVITRFRPSLESATVEP